jgi:enoyl-CoA hydratase
VGKAKAMDMVLTGEPIDAAEARAYGLVSKVTPVEKTVEEALRMAGKIASLSQPIVAMAKECVNAAYEMSQAEGVHYERRMFHSTFATVRPLPSVPLIASQPPPHITTTRSHT